MFCAATSLTNFCLLKIYSFYVINFISLQKTQTLRETF